MTGCATAGGRLSTEDHATGKEWRKKGGGGWVETRGGVRLRGRRRRFERGGK